MLLLSAHIGACGACGGMVVHVVACQEDMFWSLVEKLKGQSEVAVKRPFIQEKKISLFID